MTHLNFISAAYALGVGTPIVLAILSWQRLRRAQARLAAIDPRMANPGMAK